MNEQSHESGHSAELLQLLAAAVLGDATDAQTDRLNDLLESSFELRHIAARFLEEEAVLREEFQVLGRVGDFHSPPAGLADAVGDSVAATACGNSGVAGSLPRRGAPYFSAAALVAVLLAGVLWMGQGSLNGTVVGLFEPGFDSPGIAGEKQLHFAIQQATMLPRVTKVSWAGPHFAPPAESQGATVTMREGIVPFTEANGRAAQGYMVHLPPGALLDLVVAADAFGENTLSVTEFDSQGRPTGRKISFSNGTAESANSLRHVEDAPPLTKFGPVGTWTERNNGLRSRYYLFTSVHKLLDRSVDDSWHVSRLSVMIEDGGFLHIGWDDSGMIRQSDREYVADEDYDDLTATIRVFRRGESPATERPELRILADHNRPAGDSPTAAAFNGEEAGFPFEVAAGEIMVVKISNRARVPFAIAVQECDTGHVRWSCEHVQPRLANVGVCAIENNTEQTQRFMLMGLHKRQPADAVADNPWHLSTHSVLFQQDAYVTVGFEEGDDTQGFERVKVDMITMGRL